MNKIVLAIFLCFGSIYSTVQAQEFKFGLKGGINKTFGGTITGIASTPQYPDDTWNAEGEIGFHGGAWAQVNFGKFFVRPEVVYSALESRFDFPGPSNAEVGIRPAIYAVDEFSIPVVVGYNVFGPLDVYVGGAYKNIINSSLEGTEPADQVIVVQETPFSAQAGAKVEFGAFGLDVRYDHNLTAPQSQPVDIIYSIYGVNRATFEDTRLNQLIVSLTIKLWDSENSGKRRRGGPCY